MDPFQEFLRPRTPDRTFSDILKSYGSEDQIGEGVLTRAQYRQQNEAVPPTPVVSQPSHSHSNDVEQLVTQNDESQDSEQKEDHLSTVPKSPVPSLISNEDGPSESTTDLLLHHPPFTKETLVAENSDLRAYAIKSHFQRMKNFA